MKKAQAIHCNMHCCPKLIVSSIPFTVTEIVNQELGQAFSSHFKTDVSIAATRREFQLATGSLEHCFFSSIYASLLYENGTVWTGSPSASTFEQGGFI